MNALRLCLGTLTVLPVQSPARVDSDVAGRAMLLAPLAAVPLAVGSGGVLWLATRSVSPLLAAALAVALLALLTRGLHLDGLADTADGLGSRRAAGDALEVMRRSDIGPFGVVTLLLVLLVQVCSLASLGPDRCVGALVLALVTSRAALPLLCRRGVPAARPDGLGALVAGTVAPVPAVLTVLLSVLVGGLAAALVTTPGWSAFSSTYGVSLVVVPVLALVLGAAYGRHCVRRLGGVTGDVLGACVEVTFTAVLAMLAFV